MIPIVRSSFPHHAFHDEQVLNLELPFGSPLLDELFKMKTVPGNFVQLAEKLNISADQVELFRNFFTEKAPKQYEKYTGEKIRTRYLDMLVCL